MGHGTAGPRIRLNRVAPVSVKQQRTCRERGQMEVRTGSRRQELGLTNGTQIQAVRAMISSTGPIIPA